MATAEVAAKKAKKALRGRGLKTQGPPTLDDWLSTGCTMLNLACSGYTGGGLFKGAYFFFVGDSRAGKTVLALQCLAEAAGNDRFAKHILIYDAPERGALMDIAKFYGSRLAARLEEPEGGASRTVQQFYSRLKALVRDKQPFIYVLDSENSLRDEADLKKEAAKERAKAAGKEDEVKGSYRMGKPKAHSDNLPMVYDFGKTGSILIILGQTRQRIGFGAQFDPRTRSGGDALTFYAQMEFWFHIKKKIKRAVRGKLRPIGTVLQVKVKKTRVTGRDRAVLLRFHPSSGFDDTGTLIHFLVEEKHWKKKDGEVTAPEFNLKGDEEELAGAIEKVGGEKKLQGIVKQVWQDIEAQCAVERKPRYV